MFGDRVKGVKLNMPAVITRHSGLFQTEVVGILCAAHRQQQVGANDVRRAFSAIQVHADFFLPVPRGLDARRVEPHPNALALEDGLHCSGHVLVFVSNQARCPFDDCYLAAKAPENLTKFQPYIAATNDDEVSRQDVEVQQRGIG